MRLDPGTRLDHFEILSAIGRGGMGEVYKARDTRLNRVVAIKVSESSFNERFEREARAIAALNHPNICTLHDVGPNYLVMEYVEGQSPRGPLPLDQALRIASQVAAALEAAHARGLVHRDLKPGNILVKPDGVVKVLDFGLVKMAEEGLVDEAGPTVEAPLTEAGIVMGTPSYMAPEQAEGKAIDKRADIWAFGVILYELLSGQRLFKADTGPSTLAQVLTKDPDFSLVPPQATLLLRRCLERDPSRRLRDIGDAMPLLEVTTPSSGVQGRSPNPAGFAWTLAGAFAVVAIGLGIVHFREAPAAPRPSVRFRIPYPDGAAPAEGALFSLSPDGNKLSFTTRGAHGSTLWVQDLDALEPRVLLTPDQTGGAVTFWSYDSRSILFYIDGRLKKAELSGGGAQTVCESPGLIIGGSSSRDLILFGALGAPGILSVPAGGGTPVPVTSVDASRNERTHLMPFFLPDGRHFLYLKNSPAAETVGIYVGSLDLKPAEQTTQRLIASSTGAFFVSGSSGNGSILFLRDSLLMAQEFDTKALQLLGEPRVIARGVGATRAFPFFAASRSGNLVYRAAPPQTSQMTWYDRRGRVLGKVGDPIPLSDAPRLNPSSTRFAISQWDPADNTNDLWLYSLSPFRALRATRGPATNEYPVWSFDGGRVAYASARSGHNDLYAVSATGDGQQSPLLQSPEDKYPLDWSRDGYLLYGVRRAASVDVWVLAPDGGTFPFLDGPANEALASFSPDGRWVVYASDESGSDELYLRAFKPEGARSGGAAGPRIPLPTTRAGRTHWRADGRELLFIDSAGNLMALPVTLGAAVQTGRVETLFQAPTAYRWDPAPDAQRFLFGLPVGEEKVAPFTVVLNWQAADRTP